MLIERLIDPRLLLLLGLAVLAAVGIELFATWGSKRPKDQAAPEIEVVVFLAAAFCAGVCIAAIDSWGVRVAVPAGCLALVFVYWLRRIRAT